MRLLDRYLLRELLIPFGYCLAGFTIFWMAFNLFDELSDFMKAQLGFTDVVEYYFWKLPQLFSVVLPIALLLALLYTMTNLARYHELTAIRAAGISVMRLSLPYFSVGILLSLTLFGLNEFFVPGSLNKTEEIMTRYSTNKVTTARGKKANIGFTNPKANRTWVIQGYNRQTTEMIKPHVEWTEPDGTRHQVYADRAEWRDTHWWFTNVQKFVYPPAAGAFPIPSQFPEKAMMEFSETPQEVEIQIKIGNIKSFKHARKNQLSVREILMFKKLHPGDKEKDALLHGRLAAPWTCLVVVLIGLPFGVATGRRNVFVGVASAIGIVFAYYACLHLSLAMGYGGRVPGWVAGWFPNLFFGAIGIYTTTRFR